MPTGTRYVAFLRGINVGGHSLITMADLKKAFERMGLKNVRTLVASGNVLFTSAQVDVRALTRSIETGLKKVLQKDVSVMLRSMDDIQEIVATDPFKGIRETPDIKLYVTFLPGKTKPWSIQIPYAIPGFRIIRTTPAEVFSVVDLAGGRGTTEAMGIIEKEFGSNVTTRNWNTIMKTLKC